MQEATVDPACEPWYGQRLQKVINVNIDATTAISWFVMDGEQEIQRGPAALGLD